MGDLDDDWFKSRETRRQTAERLMQRLNLADVDAELIEAQRKAREQAAAERLKRHDEFFELDKSDKAIARRLHFSTGDPDGDRDIE